MLAADTDNWASLGNTARVGKLAQNSSTDWNATLDGYNDDGGVRISARLSQLVHSGALRPTRLFAVGHSSFMENRGL